MEPYGHLHKGLKEVLASDNFPNVVIVRGGRSWNVHKTEVYIQSSFLSKAWIGPLKALPTTQYEATGRFTGCYLQYRRRVGYRTSVDVLLCARAFTAGQAPQQPAPRIPKVESVANLCQAVDY